MGKGPDVSFALPENVSVAADDPSLAAELREGRRPAVVAVLRPAEGRVALFRDGYVHSYGAGPEVEAVAKALAAGWCGKISPGCRVRAEVSGGRLLVSGAYGGETCLSWDETERLCAKLGLEHEPVVYSGRFSPYGIASAAAEAWPREVELRRPERYSFGRGVR